MTMDDAAAYRRAADAIEHHAWVAENGEGVPVVSETVIALVAWLRARGPAPSFVDAGRRVVAALTARTLAAEAAARGAAFREREAANEAAMLRAQVDALTAERDDERALRRDHGRRIGWAESVAAAAMRQGLDALTVMRGRNARLWERVRLAEGDPLRLRRFLLLRELTARTREAEAEAARRTTELVAIGAALGREGATAGECVAEARLFAQRLAISDHLIAVLQGDAAIREAIKEAFRGMMEGCDVS